MSEIFYFVFLERLQDLLDTFEEDSKNNVQVFIRL